MITSHYCCISQRLQTATSFSYYAIFPEWPYCVHCIQRSLSPPTHTVHVHITENTPLLCLLEVILGNILYSRKSPTGVEVAEAGLLKRWITAFQCKITSGTSRTSQDRISNTESIQGRLLLYRAVITAFPLMKTDTKDQTGARDGELGTLKLRVHHGAAVTFTCSLINKRRSLERCRGEVHVHMHFSYLQEKNENMLVQPLLLTVWQSWEDVM